jgi:Tol biopolymer transport system component
LLFDHADPKNLEIKSIDLATGQVHLLLQHPNNPIFVPHLSPDEKWISFSMVTSASGCHFYVAPFAGDHEIPQSQWILVLDGDSLERQPFSSPLGDVLYFLSDRDGFRCIWALRLDPQPAMPPALRPRSNTSTTAVIA